MTEKTIEEKIGEYSLKDVIQREIDMYELLKEELITKYPFTARTYEVLSQGKYGDGFRIKTSIDDFSQAQREIYKDKLEIEGRIRTLEDILKWDALKLHKEYTL